MKKILNLTPINSQLFYAMREEILSGRLQPNQKISIEELARRFEVSTTPVRDAVRRLETAGFVIVSPRKSVTVVRLDEKAIMDVFGLRIALECWAVELSIDRVPVKNIDVALRANQHALEKFHASGISDPPEKEDYDVHQIILKYCDNSKLVAIMDDLRGLIDWARGVPVGKLKFPFDAVNEHIEILKHFKAKEQQLAVQAMRSHLTRSCERTLVYWKENPIYSNGENNT